MNLEFYTCIPTRLSVRVAASRGATRVNWWEISHIGSPDIFEDVNNKFTNHLRGHLYVTFVEVTLNSAIAKLARRQCFIVPRSFLTKCAKLPAKKNVFTGGGGMGWHLVLSHSPIQHYAFSSWIEKTMKKTIHCHWENRFVLQGYGAVRKFYHIITRCKKIFKSSLWIRPFCKI